MKKIAVFFPGLGYHCDKPLLYYTRKLMQQLGIEENLTLNYRIDGKSVFEDKSRIPEAVSFLLKQTKEQLSNIKWEEYDEIIFISKSIGTAVASRYAIEKNITCKNIYLTPLADTFIDGMNSGIAFSGTSDPWIDLEIIKDKCNKYKIPLRLYKDANHSLEQKDIFTNIDIIRDILNTVIDYCG